jgi:Arc/MetJ-type ribon-helix-helix transcriptional regulator
LNPEAPEVEQRVRQQIQSGDFHDVDELLAKALDALDEKTAAPTTAADDSGDSLLAVLQNSRCPEIDLAPPRERVPMPVRDVAL